jgi:hypothetical protein
MNDENLYETLPTRVHAQKNMIADLVVYLGGNQDRPTKVKVGDWMVLVANVVSEVLTETQFFSKYRKVSIPSIRDIGDWWKKSDCSPWNDPKPHIIFNTPDSGKRDPRTPVCRSAANHFHGAD